MEKGKRLEKVKVFTKEERIQLRGKFILSEPPRDKDALKASPYVRKIAMEKQVDLTMVEGTGKDGRIEVSDLDRYMVHKKYIEKKQALIQQAKENEQPEDQEITIIKQEKIQVDIPKKEIEEEQIVQPVEIEVTESQSDEVQFQSEKENETSIENENVVEDIKQIKNDGIDKDLEDDEVNISPLAKTMAIEEGVELKALGSGSGPRGRIMKTDVERYLAKVQDNREFQNTTIEQTSKIVEEQKNKPSLDKADGIENEEYSKTSEKIEPTKLKIRLNLEQVTQWLANEDEEQTTDKINIIDVLVVALERGVEQFPEILEWLDCSQEETYLYYGRMVEDRIQMIPIFQPKKINYEKLVYQKKVNKVYEKQEKAGIKVIDNSGSSDSYGELQLSHKKEILMTLNKVNDKNRADMELTCLYFNEDISTILIARYLKFVNKLLEEPKLLSY